jgi:membrane-associated protease RseP (regulator of RpoE activity)
MSLKEMLWPTRWKISMALLIGAVSVFLIYQSSPQYADALFGLDLHLRIASVFMSFGMVTLIYYPLSCGVVFLLRSFLRKGEKPPKKKGEKGKKPEKKAGRKDIIMAVLLILVFNPLTFSLAYAAGSYVNVNVLSYPCGVQVFGFSENSPAEQAGMGAGEVIMQVDDMAIDSTGSLTSALSGRSPGDIVSVRTSAGEYDVQLAESPETHRAVMGVITQTAYCRRF